MYKEIIYHPSTTDELRRTTESKLIRYTQAYLHALPPSPTKQQVSSELDELVRGVIVLDIPDEFSWMIIIDGKDSETIGLHVSLLNQN